jgi:DNA-binding XRE family transcriptional regulator
MSRDASGDQSVVANLLQDLAVVKLGNLGHGPQYGDPRSPLQAASYTASWGDKFEPYVIRGKGDNAAVPRNKRTLVAGPQSDAVVAELLPPDETGAVFYERFRKRLRALREESGITQAELAEQVGIPLASYKHIEGKRASPFPLHKLPKLSVVLRQSCDYILTGRAPRFADRAQPRRIT